MAKAPDLVGQKFNRLTVISRDHTHPQTGKTPRAFWLCQCECGNTVIVGAAQLRGGHTKSCGCLSVDMFRERVTKHGSRYTPEYSIWQDMRRRCRGLSSRRDSRWYNSVPICERWNSFENFLADMGPRPSPKHSIDRIDNTLGYEPTNCRWSTQKEQMRNTRRARLITYEDRTQPLMDWSIELNISYYVLHARLYKMNWPIHKAFNTPVQRYDIRT